MSSGPEISFGVGTIADPKGDAVAVVVNDQVIPLSTIVERHRPGLPPAPDMRAFMPEWDRWHDWLRGLELVPDAGAGWRPIDSVKFRAPVTEPWNIFQPYHNFERASIVTGNADPPKSLRVLPDVFFGSRSALAGYGDEVLQERDGGRFDYEVELTAVIGRTAYQVSAAQAFDYIAGYAITNDFTMHHAWWRPIRNRSRINDNIRMKNFPGYTPMSRAIVPRDIVGDPHDLAVRTWVDGHLRQDTRTNTMLWSVGELIEYLSWIMPLRPGDLILCGSPNDLPLPPEIKPGVQPGQTCTCMIERVGSLVNPVGLQALRPPYQPDKDPRDAQ